MTEMVAAHLERVAKAVALDYEIWCDHIDDRDPAKLEEIVAAALAACARERDRLNREYYKGVLNKAGLSAAAWKLHETPILSEAERAAGEKAT